MKKFDQINVIPFIDIMLVLLAIVLITASFLPHGKIKVSLPKSNTNTSLEQSDLQYLITIDAKGLTFYNNKPINQTDLNQLLSKWIATDPNIILQVDASTSFQKVVTISELLTNKGLTNISVLTQKESSNQ